MADELLHRPLAVVDRLAREAAAAGGGEALTSSSGWGLPQLVAELLRDPAALAQIPSLNQVHADSLPPDSLVRFRGMVQDTYDTEMFVGAFEAADGTLRTGKFRDSLSDLPDEPTLAMRDGSRRAAPLYCRRPIHCVAVPGESPWVHAAIERAQGVVSRARADAAPPHAAAAGTRPRKRPLEEGEEAAEAAAAGAARGAEEDAADSKGPHAAAMADEAGEADGEKRARRDALAAAGGEAPLARDADERLRAIVKLYDEEGEALRVTDVAEFIGVLTKDPFLFYDGGGDGGSDGGDGDGDMSGGGGGGGASPFVDAAEFRGRNPPASLAFRVHCLAYRKLDPLAFGLAPPRASPAFEAAAAAMAPRVAELRASLLEYLTHVAFGDAGAGEWLLLHLVSTVTARRGGTAIGSLALNLCGFPAAARGFGEALAEALAAVAPKVKLLRLSVAALNAARWAPVKDHERNVLQRGELQLAQNTTLVVDETTMGEGRLSEVGVRNLEALRVLAEAQQLEYDFGHMALPFAADAPVLTLSCGKPLVRGVACSLRLEPRRPFDPAERAPQPPPALLEAWRPFLALARQTDVVIDDEAAAAVRADLVALRRARPATDVAALHLCMTAARLAAMTFLERRLTPERWAHMKRLIARAL